MTEGNEGNDDSQAPNRRSIQDIFRDSKEAARERAEGESDEVGEEITEEIEVNIDDIAEQKRRAALNSIGNTYVVSGPEQEIELMKDAFRFASQTDDQDNEGDEGSEDGEGDE